MRELFLFFLRQDVLLGSGWLFGRWLFFLDAAAVFLHCVHLFVGDLQCCFLRLPDHHCPANRGCCSATRAIVQHDPHDVASWV